MLFVLFYGNKLVILFLRKNYREVCIVLGIIFVNIFYLVCLSGNSSFYIEFQKIYFEIICEKDNEGRIIVYYVVCGGNKKILNMFFIFKWVLDELKVLKYFRNILYIVCWYCDIRIVCLIIFEYLFMFYEVDNEGYNVVYYIVFGGKSISDVFFNGIFE